jgi:gluconolactonase
MQLRTVLSIALLVTGSSVSTAAFAAAQAAPPEALYVPVERPTTIAAIPQVVAAGVKWEVVYTSVELQDGIVGTADGGILIAQQGSDTVRKIDVNGGETIYVGGTHGAGALALDANGRLLAVDRKEPTQIAVLAPEPHVIAGTLKDGKPLGRLSDLVVDLKGGSYITGGAFYYLSPDGVVSLLPDQDIRTNGIALSPDGKTLYVTNNTELIAFDLQPDGSTRNRRVFAGLGGDTIADGMAVDANGRVYATAVTGIHVFSPQGRELGIIPTARRATSLAFAGPGKKTLYAVEVGAIRSDGKLLSSSEGTNTARTLYKLPMLAQGFMGRAK